jgi:hypothetical protein
MNEPLETKILLTLHSLGSVLKLYETNNTAVVRQLDLLEECLNSFFAEGKDQLKYTLRSDEFFINDKLFKVDLPLYLRARDLAEALGQFDYGELCFGAQTTKADLEAFVSDYSQSLRNSKSSLKPKYGAITGRKARGSSAAAFRFDPDKMAIWLYSGLLDIVEQLYMRFESGEHPSLLPLRRSIQMIIDNMKDHGGIYQMLSAIRDIEKERSRSNTRVAIAIDSIGLGIFLGLPSMKIMDLALCGVLGGLTQNQNPLATVEPIFSFSGLGESAVGLILTLYDARNSRNGDPAGHLGSILMITESYHELLNSYPDVPLPDLIRNMATGNVEGLDQGIAQLFARYKGLYPIGSILDVDGSFMVVMGHANNEKGKKRPVVSKIQGKKLSGQLIDLSTRSSMMIKGAVSAKKNRINLASL